MKATKNTLVIVLALAGLGACVSPENSESSVIEASASLDDGGYSPQHGWVESN